ncbi:MAG: hypothetical protein U5M53_13965 [Rhodoferax sp.]|nr:hypothetical protein [Rhodoferax sp.]
MDDFSQIIFGKTALGQEEIKSKGLGLLPMVRRTLILVDGKKSGAELAVFAAGQDTAAMLTQLLEQGCIEKVAEVKAAPAKTPPSRDTATPSAPDLSSLPPAESRSAKDLDMARNFMTNTSNTMFGLNMRLTLIEAIFAARTVDALRDVYPMWEEAMLNGTATSAKRFPELRKDLFKHL